MIDISGRIDQRLIDVFEAIDIATHHAGIQYFVVGAMARDIVLHYGHQIPTRRATLDIDIAIRVAGWREFESLIDMLVAGGRFKRTKLAHRLTFEGTEIVDIVPFGPVAGAAHTIEWPPTKDTSMQVLGFEEAFRFAVPVKLRKEPALEVPVATLPGLAVMKLLSWHDQYPARSKDAEDLFLITGSYLEAGNFERLPVEAPELLNVDIFDLVVAGARLLGRDMAAIAIDDAYLELHGILMREADANGELRLAVDMIRNSQPFQDQFEYVLVLLQSVRDGFLEAAVSR